MLQYGNVDCTGKYHKLLTEEWKYGCNDPPLPPPPHDQACPKTMVLCLFGHNLELSPEDIN